MPIDELLSTLDELRRADVRLAGTAIGSAERRAALHDAGGSSASPSRVC